MGTEWMLRVHYLGGGEDCVVGDKELKPFKDRATALDKKADILNVGLQIISDLSGQCLYEYWIAPSQIIGFEILEYIE